MDDTQRRAISQLVRKEHLRFDEPMRAHTTFRVGGAAEVYVTPNEDELADVLAFARDNAIDCHILGNGSNVLVSDDGLRGIVVGIGEPMGAVRVKDGKIHAGAGARLAAVANAAADAGLTGLEFAAGIPGTVGGAVMMNAGAYGGQMADVIGAVRIVTRSGQTGTLAAEELALSYRHSVFMEAAHENDVIVSATLCLRDGDETEIRARMADYNARRREKQPLEYPSAGSTFRRPEGYFAGKLIQDAGLSGHTIGGAQVSEKHCGFLINRGGATAADIYALIRHVQAVVERETGVRLEPEVRLLGAWQTDDETGARSAP